MDNLEFKRPICLSKQFVFGSPIVQVTLCCSTSRVCFSMLFLHFEISILSNRDPVRTAKDKRSCPPALQKVSPDPTCYWNRKQRLTARAAIAWTPTCWNHQHAGPEQTPNKHLFLLEPHVGRRSPNPRSDQESDVYGWEDWVGGLMPAWPSSVGLEECNVPFPLRWAPHSGLRDSLDSR